MVSCVAIDPNKKPLNIAGTYTCNGKDATGAEYTGTVKITAHADIYKMHWTIGSLEEDGTAMFDGQTLSAYWEINAEERGLSVYKLQKDNKTLAGHWTEIGGDGKRHPETLTRNE